MVTLRSQILRLAMLFVVATGSSIRGQAINNAGEAELTDRQFDMLVFAGGDRSTLKWTPSAGQFLCTAKVWSGGA